MKRKKYSVTFTVCAVLCLLVLLAAGGCGGSGSSGTGGNKTEIFLNGALHGELAPYLGEQAEVTALDSNSAPDTVNDVVMFSAAARMSTSDDNMVQLKKAFSNGTIVALEHADASEVNVMLKAIGEDPSFELSADLADPNVEIYAVAKRGKDIFTYITRSDNNAAAEASVDVSNTFTEEESSTEEVSTDVPESGTAVSTDAEADAAQQRLRVKNFVSWTQNLDALAEEKGSEANSGLSYRTSNGGDTDLTKISQAQVILNDCSQDGRSFILTHTIYSCHSFSDGCDYYLVEMDSQLNPSEKYFKRHTKPSTGNEYDEVRGYMSSYNFKHQMDDGSAPAGAVGMIRNAPENANSSTSTTTGFSWDLGGSVGVNSGKPAAEISGGVSFSSSETVTTDDYSIDNQSLGSNAIWQYAFLRPKNGERNFSFRSIDDAVKTSRSQFQPHSKWIWKVSSDYRDSKQTSGQILQASFRWTEGYTRGDCGTFWIYGTDRIDRDTPHDNSISIQLKRPPLIAADKSAFDFSKDANHATLSILSQKNWTISSDSSWCAVDPAGGSATGETQKQILIEVDKNDTGAARTAWITITDGNEKAKIEVQQSKY